jgi:serine kinase of HPr protein (carbohydrate metabolism regulator)
VTMPKANLHATALLVGGKGVIIFGASGAGKTSLALELIREAVRDNIDANLVADDRVNVALVEGRLEATPPTSIAGLVEVRGSGIHAVSHTSLVMLDLAVELVKCEAAERLAPQEPYLVAHGIALPALRLPIGDTGPQVRAILAHLGLYVPLKR